MPNAIVLAYHGPANGSDPFSFYNGNTILSSLGLSAYPTGVIDRVSGVQSRSAWMTWMTNRNAVPATVAINISRTYNVITRTFNASIDFTALQNLSGNYKFNVILVEDGIIWPQAGTLGGPNYVHDWTVRDMMNGALGTDVINGAWNQGQVINQVVNRTIPPMTGGGPDIVPDSCRVIVMVYEVGSPLNANAEIQQAEQLSLVAPDYVASMQTQTLDILASNTTLAQYDAKLYNIGLMQDKYYFSINYNGPAGWNCDFTTPNGTFPAGQMDSVIVDPDDSVTVSVNIDPSGLDGYGQATLNYLSANNPGTTGDANFRFVTETGLGCLVVDATAGVHQDTLVKSLDKFMPLDYGVVSRAALQEATVTISNFSMIFWSGGRAIPAFSPGEVILLQNYLTAGGNLFINGQDIGNDIFGTGATSQHAQSFYNNYLHASFVGDAASWFIVNGYAGDPISDGISFLGNDIYPPRSYDKIAPFDADATEIFTYFNGPDIAGIRAESGNHRIVYLGLGFENIIDEVDRDSILARSIRWFGDNPMGIGDNSQTIYSFQLTQNYPNPFNPETTIKYTLDNTAAEQTTLIIYNSLGQAVKRLVNTPQSAGNYEVRWMGTDDFGSSVASGIYYYQLKSGQNSMVQKMILIR
jgi:hypothetical protein